MKSRNMCLYVNRRNEDVLDLIDEYADMWNLPQNGAIFHIIRDYSRLHLKERIREMDSILDKVEQQMLKELMSRGAITGKKYTDQKKYIKEVIRRLYLNL